MGRHETTSLPRVPRSMRSGLSQPYVMPASVFGNAVMAELLEKRLTLSKIDAADWHAAPEGVPHISRLWGHDTGSPRASDGLRDPTESIVNHLFDLRVRSVIGDEPVLVPDAEDPRVLRLGKGAALLASAVLRDRFGSIMPVQEMRFVVVSSDNRHAVAEFVPGPWAQVSGMIGIILVNRRFKDSFNAAELLASYMHELVHGVQFASRVADRDEREWAEQLTMSFKERYRVPRADRSSHRGPLDPNARERSFESIAESVRRHVWVLLGLDTPEWTRIDGHPPFFFE